MGVDAALTMGTWGVLGFGLARGAGAQEGT